MKISLLAIYGALLLLAGCGDKKQVATEEAAPVVAPQVSEASLADYRSYFKYTDLDSFTIDTFNWDNRIGQYRELDSTSFKLVWQNSDRVFIGQGYDRDYFHSWQNRNPDFIEFTVLRQDESSYCNLLHYFIFDKNGKAIDNFIVAARCGDGGWVFDADGKFISEDTYEEIAVETEVAEIDAINNTEIVEGDSTVTHYTIGPDGRVNKKEVSKTPIRRIYN